MNLYWMQVVCIYELLFEQQFLVLLGQFLAGFLSATYYLSGRFHYNNEVFDRSEIIFLAIHVTWTMWTKMLADSSVGDHFQMLVTKKYVNEIIMDVDDI